MTGRLTPSPRKAPARRTDALAAPTVPNEAAGRPPKWRTEVAKGAESGGVRRTGEDGRLRLHVVFQDARHAEWALWQHAMYAEVEAPQWLRTSLHHRATVIAARYGPPA